MTKRKLDVQYTLTQDVVIRSGTVLRRAPNELGGSSHVCVSVPLGKDFAGDFVVQVHKDAMDSGFFQNEATNARV